MRASVGLFLTSPKDPKPVIQQTTILLYVFFFNALVSRADFYYIFFVFVLNHQRVSELNTKKATTEDENSIIRPYGNVTIRVVVENTRYDGTISH